MGLQLGKSLNERGVTAPRSGVLVSRGATMAKWKIDKLDLEKYAKLQSKVAVQRNEITSILLQGATGRAVYPTLWGATKVSSLG